MWARRNKACVVTKKRAGDGLGSIEVFQKRKEKGNEITAEKVQQAR